MYVWRNPVEKGEKKGNNKERNENVKP